MRYRRTVRISYTVKMSDGFIEERKHKFPTMHDAIAFLKELKLSKLIGRPVVEEK